MWRLLGFIYGTLALGAGGLALLLCAYLALEWSDVATARSDYVGIVVFSGVLPAVVLVLFTAYWARLAWSLAKAATASARAMRSDDAQMQGLWLRSALEASGGYWRWRAIGLALLVLALAVLTVAVVFG